jgi:hypothetical protein
VNYGVIMADVAAGPADYVFRERETAGARYGAGGL